MSLRNIPLSEALVEVSSGVGPKWSDYRVLGATRAGLALAKEPVGKSPERYKLVEPGTIFYNPMRIMIGSIAMVDDDDEPGITSPDYVVFRTRPGVLHHRWFYSWLRSKHGEALIRSLARGAVRERLLFKRLVAGRIAIPDWETQNAIAPRLEALRNLNGAVDAAAKAADLLTCAYLEKYFPAQEPRSWRSVTLGDVIKPRTEIVHPKDHPSGPAVFVGLEHIASQTGIRLGEERIEMSELTGRKARFYRGDIVYGYLRPYLNKVWRAEFDGLCSVDQYVYTVNAKLADTRYIAWFMRSPTYLKRAPIDTTPGQLPRIRLDEVAGVRVNLPPLSEQRRRSEILDAQINRITAIRRNLEFQRETASVLRVALLNGNASGKKQDG